MTFGLRCEVPREVPGGGCSAATGATAKLYAAHLKPEGASYTGELEEFITGTPCPLPTSW